jgi:sterol desaturase/sphingolipid hydroxylase (fatty acid hydroxylase superfamily)
VLISEISIFISIAIASIFIGIEKIRPLYPYSSDKSWLLRLLIFGGLGVFLTTVIGIYLVPHLGRIALFPALTRLFLNTPDWLNGLIAYFCISFFVYWWHRLRHHSNLMWRIFHQVHHSTHRIEALTAIYAHPSDFLANAFIINVVSYFLLGLDVESAAWASLWVGIFEFWEHTNTPTPHWLGYIIVRPEMHRIHHERDRHTNNYGLPIWDIFFGTYENSSRKVECGFDLEAESKVKLMLSCRDIS